MPLDERKDRWHAMMVALRANSVHDWASHFLQLSPTKPKAGSSTGRWTEPGFQGPPAWTSLARSEPLRAAFLSSFLINLGRKAQLRGRSFARSALFHWFRALRAYPRPATRSLKFYNTTSLWFPEWRCFHIEPPCFISCG
jgi:hypothetical protein